MNKMVAELTTVREVATNRSRLALTGAVRFWFFTALVGQWIFAFYVIYAFGNPLLAGQWQGLSRTVPGIAPDAVRDASLLVHVFSAAVLNIFGLLQMLPIIRKKWPALHRWNGRLFLGVGLAGAVMGLYLTWIGGLRLSNLGAIGISVNGILIVVVALKAWQAARVRAFAQHKRWALHAFMLVSGVWSFRLGLMAWFVINRGPNGNTAKLDGPFDLFWSFACYLLPMAMVELYLHADRANSSWRKWLCASVITLLSLLMALGIVAAYNFMWFPAPR